MGNNITNLQIISIIFYYRSFISIYFGRLCKFIVKLYKYIIMNKLKIIIVIKTI